MDNGAVSFLALGFRTPVAGMSVRMAAWRAGWVLMVGVASCGGEVGGEVTPTSGDAGPTGGWGNVEASGGHAGRAESGGGSTSTGGTGTGGTCTCAMTCPSSTRPICVPSGQCACTPTCDTDPTKCGLISRCPSVCDPSGLCVCAGTCLEQGQIGIFSGCCSGLTELAYVSDVSSCTTDEGFIVCSLCGNGVCDRGENRCNCPQDCR